MYSVEKSDDEILVYDDYTSYHFTRLGQREVYKYAMNNPEFPDSAIYILKGYGHEQVVDGKNILPWIAVGSDEEICACALTAEDTAIAFIEDYAD